MKKNILTQTELDLLVGGNYTVVAELIPVPTGDDKVNINSTFLCECTYTNHQVEYNMNRTFGCRCTCV